MSLYLGLLFNHLRVYVTCLKIAVRMNFNGKTETFPMVPIATLSNMRGVSSVSALGQLQTSDESS
jgi:hypothetical protein